MSVRMGFTRALQGGDPRRAGVVKGVPGSSDQGTGSSGQEEGGRFGGCRVGQPAVEEGAEQAGASLRQSAGRRSSGRSRWLLKKNSGGDSEALVKGARRRHVDGALAGQHI